MARKAPIPQEPILVRITTFARTHRSMHFLLLWLVVFSPLVAHMSKRVLENENYLEVFPSNLTFIVMLHAITALWVAAIVYIMRWPRSFMAKVIAAGVLGMMLFNYDDRLMQASGLLKALIPALPDGAGEMAVVSAVFLVLIFAGALMLGRAVERLVARFPKIEPQNVTIAMLIVVGFTFVGPVYNLMRILPYMTAQASVEAPNLPKPDGAKVTDKPDIYYIVLDRYTNNQELQQQFGFDNGEFTNFLRDNQFTVNEGAYSHYPYTTASIASTLSGQYTNKLVAPFKNEEFHTRTLYHNIIRQAPVIKALKQAGYEYHSVGSWYGASNKTPLADNEHMYNVRITLWGKEKKLRDLEENAFMVSPYYRFANLPIPGWPLEFAKHGAITSVRQQLNTLDSIASAPEQGGRFVFAHILVPHHPYIFNADGTTRPDTGSQETMAVKDKYIQQVRFINSQMQELVERIQKNSGGQAVILLNADEGEYPMHMESTFKTPAGPDDTVVTEAFKKDMREWPDNWLKMKYGIQQTAYIPKATAEDMANLSSVNLFRVVLNRYAGYNLNYLPSCHFALYEGWDKEFKYVDLTQRLYGQANVACKEYESR